MNTTCQTSHFERYGPRTTRLHSGPRTVSSSAVAAFYLIWLDLPVLLLALRLRHLTGCSFLKPAKATARHFVLTPLPAAQPPGVAPGALAVGLGQVKLPAYLFETSLAVRKGTNEIEYLPSALWAERLDTGFQRVLAANLAILLPSEHIRLSAWKSEDVAAEVYVTIRAVRRGRQRPGSARRLVAHPLTGRREDSQGRRDAGSRARARRRTPPLRRRRHPERPPRRFQPPTGAGSHGEMMAD